ncbi:MAG: polysaccharide deacetylase family protein [Cyanobacteriota bacterium]|nr:polysaccharide deacetylase family protein [Cyanobacteriota bacterium]
MALLKRVANRGLDLLFPPGSEEVWAQRLRGRILCLLYHRVDEPGRIPFLDHYGVPPIPPRELKEELDLLSGLGADFLTFADLRRGHFPGPSNFGVIVCFDDGLRCNYSHGLAVLDVLSIPGVIFQSSALIEASSLIWEHSLYFHGFDPQRAEVLREVAHSRLPSSAAFQGDALVAHLREEEPVREVEAVLAEVSERSQSAMDLRELARALYPTADQLRRLRGSPHEIGSHGHHHYPRSGIDEPTFRSELIRSREVLEAMAGQRPLAYSHPFNSHGPGDAAICAEYYEQVATVDARPITPSTPAWELPRCTWPGPLRNGFQRRRWLLTGHL